jgi:hypothetical protein
MGNSSGRQSPIVSSVLAVISDRSSLWDGVLDQERIRGSDVLDGLIGAF